MTVVNYNISFKATLRFATISTRHRAKRLYLISHVMSSKRFREVEYLGHSYLRWIDDVIDNSKESTKTKKNFLSAQAEYFEQLENGSDVIPKCIEEACFYFFIKKCNELQLSRLIKSVKEIFSAFEIDLDRFSSDNYLTEQRQSNYIKLIHKGMFDFIYLLLMGKPSEKDKFVGPFFWHVNTLRDLKEDLQTGVINITREEIKQFEIKPSLQLNDPNLTFFIKHKVGFIEELLWKEVKDLQFMPLKVRLFWSVGYIPMIFTINRIESYNYQLACMHDNSIITEMKVLIKSMLKIIRIFSRVFSNFKANYQVSNNI
jgi:hypothetical protein